MSLGNKNILSICPLCFGKPNVYYHGLVIVITLIKLHRSPFTLRQYQGIVIYENLYPFCNRLLDIDGCYRFHYGPENDRELKKHLYIHEKWFNFVLSKAKTFDHKLIRNVNILIVL